MRARSGGEVLVVLSLMTALVASVGGAACSDLKSAPPDDGQADASAVDDVDGSTVTETDGATGEEASTDAGQPPSDFECADHWASATKEKPECGARQVKVIDEEGGFLATGVSIARTPAGRVGIVFNNEDGADSGEMRLWHFVPKDASFTPQLVRGEGSLGFHTGYTTRLAASAPDVLHVLAHDVEDSIGDVTLRRLEGGKAPLVGDELVASGVGKDTELSMAIDSKGVIYASMVLPGASSTAKLAVRKKDPGSEFKPLPDITQDLLPDLAPRTGEASLFVGSGDQVHLLYHYCVLYSSQPPSVSTPRYHTLSGSTWSDPKTVDNATVSGLAGYSPRLVVVGTKKYATYYFRKAGQSGAPTAELRLATWELGTDFPKIEVLDQDIPSGRPPTGGVDEDALSPGYRVAMAADKFGLLHLAIVRPTTLSVGYLEYRRQVRDGAGGVKWLSDIVDEFESSDGFGLGPSFVDLVVDENARPHIAYLSGADYKVRYATRFDR